MSLLNPKTIVITTMGSKQPASRAVTISTSSDMEFEDEEGPKKRRRLTHLSAEEKMLRRKLKNRVAAQTARDRKKALMSDLEIKIAKLEAENKKLHQENKVLKSKSSHLVTENSALKERLGQVVPDDVTSSKTCVAKATSGGRVSESVTPRSAAPVDPLPKDQIQALSHFLLMQHYAAFSLTLSLMFFLVCSNSSVKNHQAATASQQRKRKQAHPSRCPVSVLGEQRRPLATEQWWGRHQQSWNPSMN